MLGMSERKLGWLEGELAASVKQAVPIWLVGRVLYILFTYLAVLLTIGRLHPLATFPPYHLLMLWQRRDVNWYLSIAARGYTRSGPDQAAFFPLYPALTALLTALVGAGNRLAAAMIVASLGTLAACIAVGLLAGREFGGSKEETSNDGVMSASMRVMLAYPLALFMFAGYADSLLVALCALSLYFGRRGSWTCAALCAFAAGLTRPTAIILVAPLCFEYGRQSDIWQPFMRANIPELVKRLHPRLLAKWLLVTAAAPLAIGLYAVYLWHIYGDPLLFMHLQVSVWHRHLVPPWQLLSLMVRSWHQAVPWGYLHARMLVDEVPVAGFLVLTYFVFRHLPRMYTWYMAGVLVSAVATPMVSQQLPFAAAGRYLLPAIPVYLLLGSWVIRRPWLDQLIIGGGMAVQAILVVFFLGGGPLT